MYEWVMELLFIISSTVMHAADPGPALMAMWSEALPLTARCPSPLPAFVSWPGHVRQLPVTWS